MPTPAKMPADAVGLALAKVVAKIAAVATLRCLPWVFIAFSLIEGGCLTCFVAGSDREKLPSNTILVNDVRLRFLIAGMREGLSSTLNSSLNEGYYASAFYSHFAAAGLDVRVEESTSRGRLDMAVLGNGQVYLFEFKTVAKDPEGTALAQLEARGYADKYRHLGQPVHLIGVEFSREDRNLTAFEVERA